jgi:hypothetical protein
MWEIYLIKGCFSTQNHIYLMSSISCLLQWPWIWFTCRMHFPVFSSFMTYPRVCIKSTMTGVTSGAGTAYPSGAPEFIPFLWEFVLLNFKCLRSVLNYYRSLSFILFFFFWPLCCMSFGLRLLITPLASSNFSFYS